ncbi:MAG: D-alanine--D-alanine ligase [Acidobacteria bacterium]|nr:D-alanine--D-alanine ligase [Acidobacteriota bacterium]
MQRLRVGVIFGGRSSEHEVSVASAAAVLAHLDPARYEPVPIHIDRGGRWSLPERPPLESSARAVIEGARGPGAGAAEGAGPGPDEAPVEAHLVAHPRRDTIVTIRRESAGRGAGRRDGDGASGAGRDGAGAGGAGGGGAHPATVAGLALDVVFPVVHGPYGEDGTLQGLLELANVPYVGAGVLGSAVAMDKAVAKTLIAARGLPQVDHCVVAGPDWDADPGRVAARVEAALPYPVFVKPCNLGSSIGVSRAADRGELRRALARAREFDRKLLVEGAVADAREIECAVLGNDAPEVSVPGEIVPAGDFYDYDAKYLDDGSELIIPARLPAARADAVREMAAEAFRAVEGAGMARVDFLLAAGDDRIYVNEVNTIPGFTTISMYAKLWEASGLPYAALLDRLIELAQARHAAKQRLRTSLTD